MIGRRNRTILILLIIMGLMILSVYYSDSGNWAVSSVQRQVISILAPVYRLANSVYSPFKKGWNYITSFNEMRDENIRLREENRRLKSELSKRKTDRQENIRLKKLIGFQSDSGFKTIPARVIGRTPSRWQAIVIIDKGREQGIRKNMPVVVAEGVVGQVVLVGKNAANVLLLSDDKSGIGVEVKRTGLLGVVEGRIDGELRLKFIPKDADIRVGDRLLTSGIGQVYPRKLMVGRVAQVKEDQYGMEKTIIVKPAVNFSKLEEVLVITDKTMTSSPVKAVSAK